ncbi:autotransporter outer membrane beta-barrel domain-containing protein, partial [Helicobacter anseris]
AAALGSNYDLYLANMNSLNKRMGELRENANAQGAWARVFNGMQTSNFSLETKSLYTTFQAGYDYAFGFNGANNYLGFALSYANANTSSNSTMNVDGSLKGISSVASNAIEFAIYNAYVQDGASKATGWKNGLYTDTILKFSYIMSNISMLGDSQSYNSNNFALTLSQELGYRFLFGKTKEWSVTPQAEVILGYLNQSNLKQTTIDLNGIQESIITLRSRIGASYGYDFKQFTENKGFNAKVYLGTYFVGDYIAGGDITLTSQLGNISLAPLASTGRFV